MSPRKPAKPAKKGFTAEERAAMRERAQEMKAEATENDVLARIAKMPEPDRTLGKRIHAIVRANAPALAPKLWYGMPAYANDDGKVVCFFQGASKFKTRYATLGFSDLAHLDAGAVWPVVFAITELNAADEAKVSALVQKAVS